MSIPFLLRFWSKWIPRRIKHNAFVLSLWACIWLLGTYPLGRPLSEGWRFMFTVSVFARIGYSAAWMFITNFTHSFWAGLRKVHPKPESLNLVLG